MVLVMSVRRCVLHLDQTTRGYGVIITVDLARHTLSVVLSLELCSISHSSSFSMITDVGLDISLKRPRLILTMTTVL